MSFLEAVVKSSALMPDGDALHRHDQGLAGIAWRNRDPTPLTTTIKLMPSQLPPQILHAFRIYQYHAVKIKENALHRLRICGEQKILRVD